MQELHGKTEQKAYYLRLTVPWDDGAYNPKGLVQSVCKEGAVRLEQKQGVRRNGFWSNPRDPQQRLGWPALVHKQLMMYCRLIARATEHTTLKEGGTVFVGLNVKNLETQAELHQRHHSQCDQGLLYLDCLALDFVSPSCT